MILRRHHFTVIPDPVKPDPIGDPEVMVSPRLAGSLLILDWIPAYAGITIRFQEDTL